MSTITPTTPLVIPTLSLAPMAADLALAPASIPGADSVVFPDWGQRWVSSPFSSAFPDSDMVFIRQNPRELARLMTSFRDERSWTTFCRFGFSRVIELARCTGLQPFIEITEAVMSDPHSEPMWVLYEISELSDLVDRIGISSFVDMVKRYKNACAILREIRGEGVDVHERDGSTRTEYRHSLEDSIDTPKTFETYAKEIDRFLVAIEKVDERRVCCPAGYFVERYGIENLASVGRIAVVLGQGAFSWTGDCRGKRCLKLDETIEKARPLVTQFDFDFTARVFELTRGWVEPVVTHLAVIQEMYPTKEDIFTLLEVLIGSFGDPMTIDDFDNLMRMQSPIDGLFGIPANRQLLQAFGLHVMGQMLAGLKRFPGDGFFSALAASSHLVTSAEDLVSLGQVVDGLSETTCALIPKLKPLIDSTASLKRVDGIVRELERLYGYATLLLKFLYVPLEKIRSIDDLETVLFPQGLAAWIREHGLATFVDIASLFEESGSRGKRRCFIELFPSLDPALTSPETLIQVARILVPQERETLERLPSVSPRPTTLEDLALVVTVISDLIIVSYRPGYGTDRIFLRIERANPYYRTVADWAHMARAWVTFMQRREKYDKYKLFGKTEEERMRNKADPVYVLTIIRQYARAFEWADKTLRSHGDLVLEAVRRWHGNYEFVNPDWKEDPEFQRQAFELNFNVFSEIKHPTPEMQQSHDDIMKNLQALQISFPTRFNTRTALEIIRNRQNIATLDPRRIALLIYPKKDHNTAFENNHIEQLLDRGYQVLYFEIGDETDAAAMHTELTKIGALEHIPVCELGAHSDIFSMNFGAEDPILYETNVDASRCFDALNPISGLSAQIAGLEQYLSPQGIVLAHGCGTGGGEASAVVNVVKALAILFPGRTVHGPTIPTSSLGYEFGPPGENGLPRVVGARYTSGRNYRYLHFFE